MSRPATQRVLQNTAFLFSGRLISRLLQFLLFIYAVRRLGAESFGVFSSALALVTLFSVGLDLGISEYGVQRLSRWRKQTPRMVGHILTIKCFLALVVLPVMLTVGFALGKDPRSMQALGIIALAIMLDEFAAVFHAVFEAHEKMIYSAAVYVVGNCIMSVAGIGVLYWSASLILFCWVSAFGAALRLLLALGCYRFRFGGIFWNVDIQRFLHLVRKGLPFALVTVFITVYYYIDVLILDVIDGEGAVGYYSAAYRLIEAPLFISTALATALFPSASRLFQSNRHELLQLVAGTFEKMAVLAFSGAMLVAFFAHEIITLIYGPAYQATAAVLPVLIFSVALIMPNSVCGTTLRATDRQKFCMGVTGVGALLNVILNLLLIPKYSLMGAAWATVLTEMWIMAAYVWQVWRHVGPIFRWQTGLKMVALNGVLFACLHLAQSSSLWVQVGLASVLLPVLLILAGIFPPNVLKSFTLAIAPEK